MPDKQDKLNSVKLSIINYGLNIRTEMTTEEKKEDDAIIKRVKNIVNERNFGKGAIMVTEAYHTDIANSNHYIYVSKDMEKKIKSFYDPFPTPFLCFHQDEDKPIGTNVYAKFFRNEIKTSNGTATGYGKIGTFIPDNSNFKDERTIDLIRDRRFSAVSIGSATRRQDMICTICNNSIFDEKCTHMPGRDYDGKICNILIDKTRFTECSIAGGYPANIDAMIKRMDIFDINGNNIKANSNIHTFTSDPWSIAIYDDAIVSQYNIAKEFDEMSNQNNISELIESYDKVLNSLKKDNDALVLALTKANNIIVSLKDISGSSEEEPVIENENVELTETTPEPDPVNEEKNNNSEQPTGESNPNSGEEDNKNTTSEESGESQKPTEEEKTNSSEEEPPEGDTPAEDISPEGEGEKTTNTEIVPQENSEEETKISAKETIKQLRSNLMDKAMNGNSLKSNSYLIRNTK